LQHLHLVAAGPAGLVKLRGRAEQAVAEVAAFEDSSKSEFFHLGLLARIVEGFLSGAGKGIFL
jgi:hypothetical protein